MKRSVETPFASVKSADIHIPRQERQSVDSDAIELSDSELDKIAGGGGPPVCPDCGLSACMC